jgi:Fe2+ or Zn2+ uptake regulation protein
MADRHRLTDRLLAAGERLTPQREAVLRALTSAQTALGPGELLAAVRRQHPHFGRATVFRTVELLVRLGLAQRLEQSHRRTVYVACAPEHHHHLVCQRCGSVQDVDEGVVTPLAKVLQRAHGFALDHGALDFYGLCEDCRSA